VQGLLLLRESGNEVAHQKRQTGNHFCQISRRSPRERNALSVQVRDVEPEDSLARRGLPDRGLEQGVIKPGRCHRDSKCDRRKLRQRSQRGSRGVRKFDERGWIKGRDQTKNEGNEEGIYQIGNRPQPKPGERRAWRQCGKLVDRGVDVRRLGALRNVHRPNLCNAHGSFALRTEAGSFPNLRPAFFTSYDRSPPRKAPRNLTAEDSLCNAWERQSPDWRILARHSGEWLSREEPARCQRYQTQHASVG
jgi:hypothetical protein